jgi:carbonic anhydrase
VSKFDDILASNAQYVAEFQSSALTGQAARGLAIITCIDSRIAPLAIVGMQPGDAKIIRNAGARVTDDVLRTLVLATHLLNVSRILVMPHTDCRMASGTESEIHAAIREKSGIDTRSVEIRTVRDPLEALAIDLERIKAFPLLASGIEVMGAMFDVATGQLRQIS